MALDHMSLDEFARQTAQTLIGLSLCQNADTILQDVKSQISSVPVQAFTAAGVNACLIGIGMGLNKAEVDDSTSQTRIIDLCEFGLHPIFKNMDDSNKAVLQRKLMQAWISKGQSPKVREVYNSMSYQAQQDTASRFLLYRCEIKLGSTDSAREALRNILLSRPDIDLIYACINEARSHRSPCKALQDAMTEILLNNVEPVVSYPPAMYRCALKLNDVTEHGEPLMTPTQRMAWVCDLLEKAMHSMLRRDTGSQNIWTTSELRWFHGFSFNHALEYMKDEKGSKVATLAQVSSAFMGELVKESVVDSSLAKLYLSTIFLECALSIVRARAAISDEDKDLLFQVTISKGGEFIEKHRELDDVIAQEDSTEFKTRALAVLAFQFEASLKTSDWAKAEQLMQYASRSDGIYLDYDNQAVLGDILLSVDAPLNVKLKLLEQVVNNCYILTKDMVKVSCWIRCLFKLTVGKDSTAASLCLEQACKLAQQFTYPEDELRWLAVHAYNLAVDFYASNRDDLWSTWGDLALKLAKALEDQGLYNDIAKLIAETQKGSQ